jgi:hypothetical protein
MSHASSGFIGILLLLEMERHNQESFAILPVNGYRWKILKKWVIFCKNCVCQWRRHSPVRGDLNAYSWFMV